MGRFIGGPCDGQNAGPDYYTQRVCGGVTYTVHEDGNYYAPDAVGPGAAVNVNTKQAGRAWHRMTRALGVDGPRAVRKSRAARKRIRRQVR